MKILAIIPARGGSKGLSRKNIKLFNGYPLIYWSIKIAKEIDYFGDVVVSTDDHEIAEIAKAYGANVPFLRPKNLAEDNSSMLDTILHVIDCYPEYEYIMLLQPTSPLRSKGDILGVINLLLEKKLQSVISVSKVSKHPLWMFTMDNEGRLCNFMDSDITVSNRQEFENLYIPNGAVYLWNKKCLVENRKIISDKTHGYLMSEWNSVDIDTQVDFDFAEFLITRLKPY